MRQKHCSAEDFLPYTYRIDVEIIYTNTETQRQVSKPSSLRREKKHKVWKIGSYKTQK